MAALNDSDHNIEIRKLSLTHRQRLGQLLDPNECWKKLMDRIPITFRPERSVATRFTYEDISEIDRTVRNSNCGFTSPTELLIDEWGTMGQFRPTVEDLLCLCQEIGAISAASYISENILQRGAIEPAYSIDLDGIDYDDIIENELTSNINDDSDVLNDNPDIPNNLLEIQQIRYEYLHAITDGFSEDRLLGVGGFSKVYLGMTQGRQLRIAVKLLTNDGMDFETLIRQVNYEIDQLPRLKHPNIIEILGYSNNFKEKLCLLYPYMPNGTLEKKLRATTESDALTADQRFSISMGVAAGLNHLHSRQKPLIHRDVKTSNILLSDRCTPKIADFGLLRFGVSGAGETVTMTALVRGTPCYMPPEATSGDVSTKWDVWSYGVVLLELLTALPVLDRNREDHDLVTHLESLAEEAGFTLDDILDDKAHWTSSQAETLMTVSKMCRAKKKKNRPTMAEIQLKLQNFRP